MAFIYFYNALEIHPLTSTTRVRLPSLSRISLRRFFFVPFSPPLFFSPTLRRNPTASTNEEFIARSQSEKQDERFHNAYTQTENSG